MKIYKLLLLSILACSIGCTKDSDKEVSTVKIKRITINEYPVTNGAVAWDDPVVGSSTGADISWEITGPQNFSSSTYWQNAGGTTVTFTLSTAVYLDKPKEQYTLLLWDLDDLDSSDLGSADDLMKSLTFTPWKTDGDEDRDNITIYDNNTEIVIDVEYLFE
ncbi:MAG: hypothetical protein RLZZ262_1978 [Bacteroidota bacterium]|jgi:hypothetical protein